MYDIWMCRNMLISTGSLYNIIECKYYAVRFWGWKFIFEIIKTDCWWQWEESKNAFLIALKFMIVLFAQIWEYEQIWGTTKTPSTCLVNTDWNNFNCAILV